MATTVRHQRRVRRKTGSVLGDEGMAARGREVPLRA